MSKSQKLVIGSFWLVGLILILVATVNLSIRFPSLESLIEENQKKIEIDYATDMQLKSEIDFSAIDRSILSMMNGLNITDKHYIGLYDRLLAIDQQILGYIEVLKSGNIPSEDQRISWQTGNLSEIDEKADKAIVDMASNRNIARLYKERADLAKTKSNLLFWTTIFQIIGLVLTQTGIFLELIWKKDI